MFFLRLLAAYLYRAVYQLHHLFFLRPGTPLRHSLLVVVGGFRTGGAGKTPFCIWLAQYAAAKGNRVAVLCHRYAFDEIEMLQRQFANDFRVKVFATKNRYRTAHRLDDSREFDVILCDDGFEDSRLVGAVAMTLLWEPVPTRVKDLWPAGNARSLARDHRGRQIELRCMGDNPDVRFVVDKVFNLESGMSLAPQATAVNVVCGLGDPERFCRDICAYGLDVDKKFFLRDHDRNFVQKLEDALQKYPDALFVISQKDSARLPKTGLPASFSKVFVASQKVNVAESVLQLLYFLQKKD